MDIGLADLHLEGYRYRVFDNLTLPQGPQGSQAPPHLMAPLVATSRPRAVSFSVASLGVARHAARALASPNDGDDMKPEEAASVEEVWTTRGLSSDGPVTLRGGASEGIG